MIAARLVGDRQLPARLQALPHRVEAGLGRAMLRLAQDLASAVADDKLDGQVLQVRSGALQASIGSEVDIDGTSFVATVGSDLRYAAAQEYGFSGTVEVRAHLRRIREAFGRPIAAKTVAVRGFSRRMDLPERSFLRSALADFEPQIEAAAAGVVAAAVGR